MAKVYDISIPYHIALDSDIKYKVQPYFNYVALDYNERNDMETN